MSYNYWQGKKIRLRALEEKDVSFFQTYDDEVMRNFNEIQLPETSQQILEWMQTEQKPKAEDQFFWIAEDVDGNVIGEIGTSQCKRRHGTFKYGIALSRNYHGKGYAKEMILLVLRYFFMELRYQKVTPHVYSFNEPSIKLHERMGFVREGQLRNMVYTNGQYYDAIYFGMTKQEYESLYGDYFNERQSN
jgi:RimJ/RimL family protein N-acetyltransferase